MPYVLRRDNSTLFPKCKFQFFRGDNFPISANRFDHTVNVPVFKYRAELWDWVNKLGYTKKQLESYGYELVQVRNRKIEGLMVHAVNYNNTVRALCGTSAMMSALYHRLGYPTLAKETEDHCKRIKAQLARTYAETKRKLEEGMKDAKSRQ
jgi:hypothetical protein